MAFTVTTQQYVLVMYFEGDGEGWSERLFLPSATITDALTLASSLMAKRLFFLPFGCQINWAKVSSYSGTRDGRGVPESYPVSGKFTGTPGQNTPTYYEPNRMTDAVMVRLETAEGAFSNRWYHGVPDIDANSDELQASINLISGDTPPVDSVPGTTTWYDAIAAYLWYVQHQTNFFRTSVESGTEVWSFATIAAVIPRKFAGHKTGRPFGESRGRAIPR